MYQYAVAVYPDSRGCGQVSTIDAKTGRRGPTRTAYADPEVTLSSDGTTVLSAGDSRLELWRSDMVRMLSYGSLDARIKPGNPAPPLCRLLSAAASSAAVSVLESCPNQADTRLTLLRPSDEEDPPELKIRAAARRDRRLRRPGHRRLRHHHGRLRADAQADREHRRRDWRDDREHSAAQAAYAERDDVTGR